MIEKARPSVDVQSDLNPFRFEGQIVVKKK